MFRKLKTSDVNEALKKVPMFEACSDDELQQIMGLTSEAAVHDGQVLCREGDRGHEFFVLMDCSATLTSADGRTVDLGPGDFFGELALLDDGPRTMTATMTSEGHVLVMTGTEFRSLLRSAPGIAVNMLAVLAARLRASEAG